MLYRIDLEHFLTHAVDHFTREDIGSMEFAVISAGVKSGGRCAVVVKFSHLYPSFEIQDIYKKYLTKDSIRELYFKMLKKHEMTLHSAFVNTILHHVNVVIMCRRYENVYIDLLCEFLSENYSIECIDLNKLFIEGRVGTLYIDRDKIHNKTVSIKRKASKENFERLAKSKPGRMSILKTMMSKQNKIDKLKELGISVTKADYDSLDELLIEEWVEDKSLDEDIAEEWPEYYD